EETKEKARCGGARQEAACSSQSNIATGTSRKGAILTRNLLKLKARLPAQDSRKRKTLVPGSVRSPGVDEPFKPDVVICKAIVFPGYSPAGGDSIFDVVSGPALVGDLLAGADGQALLGCVTKTQLAKQIAPEEQSHGLRALLGCERRAAGWHLARS